MRNLMLTFVFLKIVIIFFSQDLYAQNVFARYKATMQINIEQMDGYKPNLPNLEFDCYYYKKGTRYISFLKPMYIDKYPKGYISYDVPNSGPNFYASYRVNMDTLISPSYKDSDSLIWRLTDYSNATGTQRPQYYFYESGWQEWKILPETRQIGGLTCQRAQIFYDLGNGKSSQGWDLWFCPDIPVTCNIANIIELPGLVIEGDDLIMKTKYALESYQISAIIDDKVFWPDVFNKKFIFRGNLKTKVKTE